MIQLSGIELFIICVFSMVIGGAIGHSLHRKLDTLDKEVAQK